MALQMRRRLGERWRHFAEPRTAEAAASSFVPLVVGLPSIRPEQRLSRTELKLS
jgi:hypothetical protein